MAEQAEVMHEDREDWSPATQKAVGEGQAEEEPEAPKTEEKQLCCGYVSQGHFFQRQESIMGVRRIKGDEARGSTYSTIRSTAPPLGSSTSCQTCKDESVHVEFGL